MEFLWLNKLCGVWVVFVTFCRSASLLFTIICVRSLFLSPGCWSMRHNLSQLEQFLCKTESKINLFPGSKHAWHACRGMKFWRSESSAVDKSFKIYLKFGFTKYLQVQRLSIIFIIPGKRKIERCFFFRIYMYAFKEWVNSEQNFIRQM